MKNKYLVVMSVEIDPKDSPNDLRLVSFSPDVLDKYNKSDVDINDGVGLLRVGNSTLPIDVQENCVNTFLYKLANLPDNEQKHFAEKNIAPMRLSRTAYRRWVEANPF